MSDARDQGDVVPEGCDLSLNDSQSRSFEAGQVFSPAAPIDQEALFAGRSIQRTQLLEAIGMRGRHAVVYGERGVGKTSLMNMVSPWLESFGKAVIAPRVNCDGTDTFGLAWRKMFSEVQVSRQAKRTGIHPHADEPEETISTLADELTKKAVTPDDIRRLLMPLGQRLIMVLIFDEFDRIADPSIRRMFADTIKALSDHAVQVTVVLVGVADTIDALIEEHRSIERALAQIQIRRMESEEIGQIITNGLGKLGMTIDPDVLNVLVHLSQGLPHYTHLMGLHAAQQALVSLRLRVREDDLAIALRRAVEVADHSIRDSYENGIRSGRRDNLYADVILACAITGKEALGTFPAAAVRDALKVVTGKDLSIATFAQHLNNLCEASHGSVLQRSGEPRRFRYRFTNPMMQPFVVIRAYSEGRLSPVQLRS
jgi:Cdc6-like AAA superfamily ATPase